MKYIRAILNDIEMNKVVKILGFKINYNFAFKDYCYVRSNNLNDKETLKIREYIKNEWNCKDVLAIRKSTAIYDDVKNEVLLEQKEFQTIKEAMDYVDIKYPEFKLSFVFSRDGIQCTDGEIQVWVENVEFLGISVEIGFSEEEDINIILDKLPIKFLLNKPLPEVIYELINRN